MTTDFEWRLAILRDRKEAERQNEKLQRKLIDTARRAGMAEVATGVLHNVGNVVTSLRVCLHLLDSENQNSKVPLLEKSAGMLLENGDRLEEYLTGDSKWELLPELFSRVSSHLSKELSVRRELVGEMGGHIQHILQIVIAQQAHGKSSGLIQIDSIDKIVEDALRLSLVEVEGPAIEVVCDFADIAPFSIDRHKVLQIVTNLISNAKQALQVCRRESRTLELRTYPSQDRVVIEVSDNGVGISDEDAERIFSYGFTTKESGHGYGLHASINAAVLRFHSRGLGEGSTFTLELPAAI